MVQPFFPNAGTLSAVGVLQTKLHQQAAEATERRFGKEVFVRGVVEVSNFCRQNCHYCGMRRDNRTLPRYRAQLDQLADLVIHHRPASITDLNIQAGEDPVVVREIVLPLIKMLVSETNLGISVCLGTLNEGTYSELKKAGAALYIIKFETADAALYQQLEGPGNHETRLRHIRNLANAGWQVSSGFIAGLPGEEPTSLLQNFARARELPLCGCSVSPFIPGESTPLAAQPSASLDLTLNCMAALRLMRPELVIPAVSALNLVGPKEGYRRGLRAGANLCTINLTPPDQRGDYLLYKRDRYIMDEERILSAIESEGLNPSPVSLVHHLNSKLSETEFAR